MTHLEAVELCRLIDEQCDAFELAWRRGERPAIEMLLDTVPLQARDDLLGKLLSVELELIARNGQWPQIHHYREQYPARQEIVERAFVDFETWASSSQISDLADKPPSSPGDQETERQALETGQWSESGVAGVAQLKPGTDVPPNVGRYEVIRELGRGGMGTVLLVRDPVLDRQVALKLPNLDLRDGLEVVERFHREARAMATLSHPNICPVYDAGEFEGKHFLTMAYLPGRTLAKVVQDGRLTVCETVRIVKTLAEALQFAHDAGIVHRDLKPSNVMMTETNEPIVMDFGLASRQHDGEAALTNSMTVIGSPAYMAPEQVEGRYDQINAATDVYALGIILYEMLSGRRPFEGTGLAVLGQITSGKAPAPLSTLVDVAPSLEAICHKAMAYNTADRYHSALELAEDLASLAGNQSGSILPSRASDTKRIDAKRSAARGRLVGGGAVAVVLLAAIVIAFKGGSDTGQGLPNQGGPVPDESAIDITSVTAHLLPSLPVPTKRSTGRFIDSGQELGNSTSARAVAGDIDGDRDIDVVVVNSPGTQPNQVWLNDSTGGFRPGQAFGAKTEGYGVALGDLDADGDLDVVVACRSRSIPGSVWMNDGEGNFLDSGQSLGPLFARNVTLGDIDNDGDLDAFMTHQGPGWLFLNDGQGRFLDSGQRLGNGYIRDIKLADLDDDGDLDAVVGIFRGSTLVLTNDGRGKFSENRWIGSDDTETNGIALADVDRDGKIDFFLACENQHNQLWTNAGGGLFSGPMPLEDGRMRSYEVETADLNGDGRADFFVSNGVLQIRQPNQILLAGDAGFTSSWQGDHSTQSVAIADFDGDGDLDAFLANEDGPNRVWLNQDLDEETSVADEPRFIDSGQQLGNADSQHVTLSDLDADGDLDAVVANYKTADTVWWNNGRGGFADSGQKLGASRSVRAMPGDLDGDGDLDAFIPNVGGQPNRVYINEGGGQFRDSGQELGSHGSKAAELRDFDNDGDLDALVANYRYGAANRLWLNNGRGLFTDSGQELGDSTSEGLAVADFDADGDDDVFFSNLDQSNRVWLNDGKGVFVDTGQELGDAESNGAAAADIDGDGDIDVFVVNQTYNTVWLNDGAARFTQSKQQFPGLMSNGVALTDIDGDGDVDAFVANYGPNGLWLNDGTGLFTTVQWYGGDDSTYAAPGDLDGDLDLDVFVINDNGPNRILFQQHSKTIRVRSAHWPFHRTADTLPLAVPRS